MVKQQARQIVWFTTLAVDEYLDYAADVKGTLKLRRLTTAAYVCRGVFTWACRKKASYWTWHMTEQRNGEVQPRPSTQYNELRITISLSQCQCTVYVCIQCLPDKVQHRCFQKA